MQRSTTQCQRKAQRNVNAMSRQCNSSACDKTVYRGPWTVNVLHRVQWIAATEQLDEHAASGCSVLRNRCPFPGVGVGVMASHGVACHFPLHMCLSLPYQCVRLSHGLHGVRATYVPIIANSSMLNR